MHNYSLQHPAIVGSGMQYKIIAKRPFVLHLSDAFHPQNGSLTFYLKKTAPDWIYLDQKQGLLFGTAPKVHYDKVFKISVTAQNEFGLVTKNFIIKVLCTDIVDNIASILEHQYTLKKIKYKISHIQPLNEGLLRILFEFYQQQEYLNKFKQSISDTAKDLNIKISDKVNYEDFEKVLKAINPDIIKNIQDKMSEGKLLTLERLNNHDFRNLFREGSQAQGSIAVPVWNHWGLPNLYNHSNWNTLSNVMDAAADRLIEIECQKVTLKPKPFAKR